MGRKKMESYGACPHCGQRLDHDVFVVTTQAYRMDWAGLNPHEDTIPAVKNGEPKLVEEFAVCRSCKGSFDLDGYTLET